MKIICADRVQLGHIMMLISNGICQHKRIYAALNKNICHFMDRKGLYIGPYTFSQKKDYVVHLKKRMFYTEAVYSKVRTVYFQSSVYFSGAIACQDSLLSRTVYLST